MEHFPYPGWAGRGPALQPNQRRHHRHWQESRGSVTLAKLRPLLVPVQKPRVLLIFSDDFSGVRPALEAALQRGGCDVISVRNSLSRLGWRSHWLRLTVIGSALFHYRRRARLMLERTPAAFAARSRACKAIVDAHPQTNVVMLLAANFDNYWGTPRPPGKQFVIYTDYMNLLSKGLPEHGHVLDERNTLAHWNELERRILHAQDHVFVMGKHVRPAMAMAYGIAENKLTVAGAGPGLDVDIERDGIQKNRNARRILFVGKLPEKKGLGVLMAAFATVRAVYPDAELHVVTGSQVAGPGIVFHGKTSDAALKALFYSANVFCMPAYKEPLGLVYIEAMLAKCACIGTFTGSMPELIEDGVTGGLVEPGDHAALAQQMISMFSEPDRTRNMGEAGYLRAREYWNWDAVVQRMLPLLTASSRLSSVPTEIDQPAEA
jgi:glycosyltransferase involved in cell wall biosynthesis